MTKKFLTDNVNSFSFNKIDSLVGFSDVGTNGEHGVTVVHSIFLVWKNNLLLIVRIKKKVVEYSPNILKIYLLRRCHLP